MVLLLSGAATAQQSGSAAVMKTLPNDALTATDYYKQNVYDPHDNKIGDIENVLIDKSGRIRDKGGPPIIGVGGFLGAEGCRCTL
jgi:hypothetical protein